MDVRAVPSEESRRLLALRDLHILDTVPEARFDRLARLAAAALNVPMATIAFVDGEREWFKARVGVDPNEVPRVAGLAAEAIASGGLVAVEDVAADTIGVYPWRSEAGIPVRFAAVHPFAAASGERVGVVCVLDTVPRVLSPADRTHLRDVAESVERELSSFSDDAARAAVQRAEARLWLLANTIPDGIITFGENGLIRMANAAAEQIFGWEPGGLIGQRIEALLVDRGFEHVALSLDDRSTPFRGERTRRLGQRRDGSRFPMDFLIAETRIDGERVFLALGEDAGPRLEHENAQRMTRDRFRTIFDSASLGITLSDSDGAAIVDANTAFADLVGYPREHLYGLTHGALALPEDVAEIDGDVQAWLQGGGHGSIRRELRVLRGDGTPIWVKATLSAVHDETGTLPVSIVTIFEDVTDRREIERTRSELISVVGHELRTPLTSIRGSLGLVDAGILGDLPDEAAQMVTVALTNTERLVSLVNDILDLERIDAGRLQLLTVDTPVREMVDQSITAVQAAADEAGVSITAYGHEAHVHADPQRVVQVLVNLIGNAVKFSTAGTNVRVTWTSQEQECVIAVIDTGRGIPPEQLNRIFERFSQVDASDSRDKEGTGLGLAIAKRIVERHGGRIWAESPPEGGCVMRFTLPGSTQLALR